VVQEARSTHERKPAPPLNVNEEKALKGQTYVDYDLIYIYNDMLFNGSKHVDGRGFDKPENRPTNLQIPLVRQQ
jgi:hypothetical protein